MMIYCTKSVLKIHKNSWSIISPSASFLVLHVHWIRAWVAEFFYWDPNWSEMMSSFFSKRSYCLSYIIFSRILSMLESKEIGLQFEHFSLETFSYMGFILLVFKIFQRKKIGYIGLLPDICLYSVASEF